MSYRAPIFLLGLAALVALGVFLLFDEERSPTIEPANPATADAGVARETAQASPFEPDTSADSIETDRFDRQDEVAQAPEAQRTVPRFVHVVDPRGRSIPNAVVHLVRKGAHVSRRENAFSRKPSPVPYRVLRTDPEGRAPLHPLPRTQFTIEAWTDSGFGTRNFSTSERLPGPTSVRVTVHESPPVRVELAQADGTPCRGVRVEVHPEATKENRRARALALWTDHEGVARGRLTHQDRWARDGAQIHATVRFLNGTRLTSPPTPFSREGYVFKLTVPPLVALTLDLVKPDGSPMEDESATLTWWRGTDSADTRPIGTVVATGGSAVIGGLPPGERIHFRITAHGREEVLTAIDVDASARAQRETATVGRRKAILRTVLTTADGTPLPRIWFRQETTHDDDSARESRILALDPLWKSRRRPRATRTRVDGSMTFEVRSGVEGEIRLFTYNPRGRRRDRDDAPPALILRFPDVDEEGEHDLGAIAVPSYEALAGGKVVDSDGVGVPAARITIELETFTGGKTRSRDLTYGYSEADGRFLIFGATPGTGTLRIDSRSKYGASVREPFSLGHRSLTLAHRRFGSIGGRIRLADPTVPVPIEVRATRVDLEKPRRVSIARDRDGAVSARQLMPGMYRVTVTTAGLEAADLTGIHVHDSEDVVPPGLADLVVGGAFRVGEVQVRNASGVPIPKVRVSVRERGIKPAASLRSKSTDRNGRAAILYRSGVDFEVTASLTGWRKRVRNPSFPLNFTVGEADAAKARKDANRPVNDTPPLVITFDQPLPRDKRVRTATLVLKPLGGDPRKPKPGLPKRERSRIRSRPSRAIFKQIARGTYDVDLELNVKPPNHPTKKLRFPMGRIRVRGVPRERFQLRIDRAAIDHALLGVR